MEKSLELTRAFGLEGKVAVVTGAASGIGREAARVLAYEDGRIFVAEMDGRVNALDAKTGKFLWRFFTVPGSTEENKGNPAMEAAAKTWTGEFWKTGTGGTMWNGMTETQIRHLHAYLRARAREALGLRKPATPAASAKPADIKGPLAY